MGQNSHSKRLPVVLIFTRYYLPAYKAGGPVRSVVNLIQQLKDKIHFKIICSDRDNGDQKPYSQIAIQQWIHQDGVDIYYAQSGSMNAQFYKERYAETQPDIIYLNSFFDRQFSMFPIYFFRKSLTPIILSSRGEFSIGALAQKSLIKSVYLKLVKTISFYKNVYWHATSSDENAQIKKILNIKSDRIYQINNIADQSLTPVEHLQKNKNHPFKVVLPARISRMKNTLYAIQVINQIQAPVQLDLIGVNEDAELFETCKNEIKQSPHHVRINYLGSVPHENLHQELMKYDMMLMPTLGENFGHSIIESLATGLPVVISDKTPWRSLKEKNIGFDLSLDHQSAFVQVINSYIQMSDEEFYKIKINCLNFVKEYRQSSQDAQLYYQMFMNLISSSSSGTHSDD